MAVSSVHKTGIYDPVARDAGMEECDLYSLFFIFNIGGKDRQFLKIWLFQSLLRENCELK